MTDTPPLPTMEEIVARFEELTATYTTTINGLQARVDALSIANHDADNEITELRDRINGMPATAPISSKVLAPKPEPFTGSDFKGFLRAMDLYFLANRSAFSGAQPKILYALGLLKGDLPGIWARNYCDAHRSVTGGLVITDSWNDFTKQLHEAFGDPNEAQHAQSALLKLRQSGKTAEQFFQEFDVLRRRAGYTDVNYDTFLIRLLEGALDTPIITNVISMTTVPSTYAGWKEAATRFDNHRRRLQEILRNRAGPPIRRPPPPIPSRPVPPTPAPAAERRDSTGVTFGGAGQPMDVTLDRARRSRSCYLCGSNRHLMRECPQRQQRVRLVIRGMDVEERRAWADEFGTLKESDLIPAEEQELLESGGGVEEDFVDLQQ